MRKIIIFTLILFMVNFILGFSSLSQSKDKELLNQAKILMFDEEWEKALKKLNELLRNYRNSRYYSIALFYKGKCLEELGKRKEALSTYEEFIKVNKNKNLKEEAEISIIDIMFDLYHEGYTGYFKKLEGYLKSPNKLVRYYTAFKFSYFKDKKIAKKGVPILKEIISKERNEELKDRAKIALLRIDPYLLKEIQEKEEYKKEILKIRVYEKGKSKPVVSINIPFSLADLAFKALSDKQKEIIREKGYDIDKILKDLSSGLSIEIEDEKEIIKIWIEKIKKEDLP
ncbi:tetratricopeptide repeat protein [Candidatus Aminicenantes bacterium AC-335-A11]|jgi:tetratricopeptide (TPR) repeat protein|nr:tetratricopeptide repeat protein [SCandidatus Aminicenantes bacterium Aminicenantia_JdfR_composite]MCP2598349.1 tetratricopeptide repeat protein [Candidatus Aminicenantes bacterium AC-335-L06]MCP2618591.1 tetratricopeptide repeat protein [Candidatus Aminicenantes bacterium AC-335-A11]